MEIEIRTVEEAITILKNLDKSRTLAELKKQGEAYILPLEMLIAIDVISRTPKDKGGVKFKSDSSIAAGGATLAVPSGVAWEILLIQATFLVDATVADRTCNVYFPELGMGGIAGASPTNIFVGSALTLSASQFGYAVFIGDSARTWKNDNGASSVVSDKFPTPINWLGPGADIFAKITANKAAADNQGIDVLYKEHALEVVT